MRQDLHASVMFDNRKSKEKTPLASPTHGINANTQLNEQIRTLGSKISIRDLLKNVKDSNGDRYFRQEDLAEQQYRASVTFQDGKSLVSMMKTADRSSFLHESGHIFLKDMADFINSGKVSEQDIADCPHKYKQRAQKRV